MGDTAFAIRRACSMASMLCAALGLMVPVATGCTRALGPTALGTVGPGNEGIAVMRLRPGVEASSCRRWLLGIPLDAASVDDDPVAPLVAQLLSSEPEASVLSEAAVRWEHFSAGIYERQCVTVRGTLGRPMRTITIPRGADEHGGHEPMH